MADAKGLCIEVRPNGSKLWRYRYRLDGKASMFSLGAEDTGAYQSRRASRVRTERRYGSSEQIRDLVRINRAALVALVRCNMAKKLSAAVGSYQKDAQDKVRWQNIGVIMESNGKEYVLLDPTVCLGGILALQNAEAMKKGEQLRDRIMVGVFEEDQQGGQQAPQQQPQRQYDPSRQNETQSFQQPVSHQQLTQPQQRQPQQAPHGFQYGTGVNTQEPPF